jgi:hypothetical protein
LDEENSKHVRLAQQNGFAKAAKQHSQGLTLAEKRAIESNRYDVASAPRFCLPIIMIGPSALLLVVSHLFAVPVLVLWVGLEIIK